MASSLAKSSSYLLLLKKMDEPSICWTALSPRLEELLLNLPASVVVPALVLIALRKEEPEISFPSDSSSFPAFVDCD
jgi:hypothetical protein